MRQDGFSRCHPAVCFAFFAAVIGFSAVISHPAYTLAAFCGAMLYSVLLLGGRAALKRLVMLLPVVLLITFINPILNTNGKHTLFLLFGRKYTFEALCYGASIAGMFAVMLLWFGCYSEVMTADRFTALFGNLIPSLSLLLVMVLRLIPGMTRKAKQILSARAAIGKGVTSDMSRKDRMAGGVGALSALTDWALEGSIVTADSMLARGYGTARRATFRRYRMTARDWLLLAAILLTGAAVIGFGGTGVSFTPRLNIPMVGKGFAAYCALLLIPPVIDIKEALVWHFSRSGI